MVGHYLSSVLKRGRGRMLIAGIRAMSVFVGTKLERRMGEAYLRVIEYEIREDYEVKSAL